MTKPIIIKIVSYDLLNYIRNNNIILTEDNSYWDLILNKFTDRKLIHEYLRFIGYSKKDEKPLFQVNTLDKYRSMLEIINSTFSNINVLINNVELITVIEDNIPNYYISINKKIRKKKINRILNYTSNTIDYTTMNSSIDYTTINPFNSTLLPLSIKVAARTIGLDLVSVQPMSAPIGNIYGYDYVYKKDLKKERKNKYKDLFKDNELKN